MGFLFYLAFFILIYSVQTAGLAFVKIGGVSPDLVLIFAFYCGSRFRENYGVAAAGLAGFVQDCLSGGLLGINTFSKGLIGFLVVSLRENILVENFAPITIFTACASFIDGVIFYFVSTLFLDRSINEDVFFNSLPAFALYNALLGPALFYILNRLQNLIEGKPRSGLSKLL
tara:strand:- start:3382 stop:3897 length:516 start_codon:yes stop_codon:yes gene_type:complete